MNVFEAAAKATASVFIANPYARVFHVSKHEFDTSGIRIGKEPYSISLQFLYLGDKQNRVALMTLNKERATKLRDELSRLIDDIE